MTIGLSQAYNTRAKEKLTWTWSQDVCKYVFVWQSQEWEIDVGITQECFPREIGPTKNIKISDPSIRYKQFFENELVTVKNTKSIAHMLLTYRIENNKLINRNSKLVDENKNFINGNKKFLDKNVALINRNKMLTTRNIRLKKHCQRFANNTI